MQQFLSTCRHWVFDMDGTLTHPVHDFLYIRQQLDIPEQADILEHLASLDREEAARKHQWLYEHEYELAASAEIAPGAQELIQALHDKQCQLAILTRNDQALAQVTLKAIGLECFFTEATILGREQAIPKPHPDGLRRIAEQWQVAPTQLIMVGDFHFDLSCARAAGAKSVLILESGNPWPELSDVYAPNCHALLNQIRSCYG